MSLLKLKTGAPSPITPAAFFSVICPKVLAVHAPICRALGGSYAFTLTGEGGGAWTLDYRASVVHEGALAGASLTVQMPVGDFSALLKGTLDVARAADDGRLRVDGDAALLGNLAAVLAPMEA